MTNKHTDKAKGRAKEAAALTGNRRLKRVAPVNMLTVIVLLVLLLTGWFGYTRQLELVDHARAAASAPVLDGVQV